MLPLPGMLTLQDLVEAVKNSKSPPACYAPPMMRSACSSSIVHAHTLQRNGGLSKIADASGRVYHFKPSIVAFVKNLGRITPGVASTKVASTFEGFCSTHDRELFSVIETKSFTGSKEQCFAFGFRSLAYELYLKQGQKSSIAEIRELLANAGPDVQNLAETWLPLYERGVDIGLQDLTETKQSWDERLCARRFDLSERFVVTLNQPPSVMCSGSFAPEFGFDGRPLQSFRKRLPRLEAMTYTLVATENTGAAIFNWLPRATSVCERFIEGLRKIPQDRLANVLMQLTFEHIANTFMAIPWWDSLKNSDQEILLTRMASGTSTHVPRDPNCLVDANWQIAPFAALATIG